MLLTSPTPSVVNKRPILLANDQRFAFRLLHWQPPSSGSRYIERGPFCLRSMATAMLALYRCWDLRGPCTRSCSHVGDCFSRDSFLPTCPFQSLARERSFWLANDQRFCFLKPVGIVSDTFRRFSLPDCLIGSHTLLDRVHLLTAHLWALAYGSNGVSHK